MDQTLTDLLQLLVPERIEQNIFRGESRDIGTPQVFGGQVLAQALSAAGATVKKGVVHSLHAYFLRRGDIEAPIVYQVDHARNGLTFFNRRVVAIQHGKQIFNMTASFQTPEDGLEHQATMPQVELVRCGSVKLRVGAQECGRLSARNAMVTRARFAADAVASAWRASLARERTSGRRRTSFACPTAPLAAS